MEKITIIVSVVHAETLENRLFLEQTKVNFRDNPSDREKKEGDESIKNAILNAVDLFCTFDEEGNKRSEPYDSSLTLTSAIPYTKDTCGIGSHELGFRLSTEVRQKILSSDKTPWYDKVQGIIH